MFQRPSSNDTKSKSSKYDLAFKSCTLLMNELNRSSIMPQSRENSKTGDSWRHSMGLRTGRHRESFGFDQPQRQGVIPSYYSWLTPSLLKRISTAWWLQYRSLSTPVSDQRSVSVSVFMYAFDLIHGKSLWHDIGPHYALGCSMDAFGPVSLSTTFATIDYLSDILVWHVNRCVVKPSNIWVFLLILPVSNIWLSSSIVLAAEAGAYNSMQCGQTWTLCFIQS